MIETLRWLVRTVLNFRRKEKRKKNASWLKDNKFWCRKIWFHVLCEVGSDFTLWGPFFCIFAVGRTALICKSCFVTNLKLRTTTALSIGGTLQGFCSSSLCILSYKGPRGVWDPHYSESVLCPSHGCPLKSPGWNSHKLWFQVLFWLHLTWKQNKT